MSEETLDETPVADDAQGEVSGGSEHFAIGDLPPGVESAESESAATDKDSGSVEEGATDVTPPPERFWSFKTADGQEKEFKSEEDAQQFFSSWSGRLSQAQRELNEVTQLNYQWQKAYEAGELSGQAMPEGKELKQAANKAASSGALEAHDWAAVNQYIRNGEGEKALQYIQWRTGEHLKELEARFESKLDERINELTAPNRFQSEVADAMTYVAQAGQAAVDDMGQPLFPEFQEGPTYDRKFVHHFRDIWLAQDYQLATDPNGVGFKAAYYEAKATYRPAPAETKASDSTTPGIHGQAVGRSLANAPRNPDGTFAKRNQALSMSDSEGAGSGSPSGSAPRGMSILEQMRDVGTSRSPHFAVSPD
jgi:hypothetical protein